MDITLESAALGSIYVMWTGLGLRAYQAFPKDAASFYVFTAFAFTSIVVWTIYDINRSVHTEGNGDRILDIFYSIHICLNPNDECNRCGGFFWALGIGLLASGVFRKLLLNIVRDLPFPPAVTLGNSMIAFLVSVGGHGFLNAVQEVYDVDTYLPAWVFTNTAKIVLGFIAGLTTVLLAASGLLTVDSLLG